MAKNLVTGGGFMQLSNDTSKNSTSPPYLVKNERSLTTFPASVITRSLRYHCHTTIHEEFSHRDGNVSFPICYSG